MGNSTPRPTWRARNAVELGAVLARIRRDRGETQLEAARQIGVHTPYLSNLENGKGVEQVLRVFNLLRHYGYELQIVPEAEHAAHD
jgi:transcriptional regulator with XRE-family HTH domain